MNNQKGTNMNTANEPPLYPFQVTLEQDPGDKDKLHFNCWAEDADHAAEQTENAYPGCKVTHEAQINGTPYVPGAAFPKEFS